jgi:hypothetical protein
VVANARAQALRPTLSGDALQIAGVSAAIAAALSAMFRKFMAVFLDGQKYQRPVNTLV